jgi:poly-gamma-glutamate capsule biosynthesis protein CapA/YwtB (metallophosphatase superfamily)
MVSENGSTYFFRRLTDIFRIDHLTFVACNGVLSDSKNLTPSEKDVLEWYTGPSSNAAVFKDGCIDAVGLESTRTGDYGTEGYADTKASLESAGLLWGDIGRAVYKEANGVKIALYCAKLTDKNRNTLISWVERVKKNNDIVILYVTDSEDSYMPSENKIEAFRAFIDAGADYVVGTNGTKLQPFEEYGEGYIVYSLGALLDGASKYPEKYTAILQINAKSDNGEMISVSHRLIYCETYSENRPWQPFAVTDDAVISDIEKFMCGERETLVN